MRGMLLFLLLLSSAICMGCAQQEPAWREAGMLPFHENVGTITQYKHFVRGGFLLSAQDTYVLDMHWLEADSVDVYLDGESGYQDTLAVASGTPCVFAVPEDGLYQIRLPLEGLAISELAFSLSAEASSIKAAPSMQYEPTL